MTLEEKTYSFQSLWKEKFARIVEACSDVEKFSAAKIITDELSPRNLAYFITLLPMSDRFFVYSSLVNLQDKIAFILSVDLATRNMILQRCTKEDLQHLFHDISSKDAAFLLGDVEGLDLEEMLQLLPEEKSRAVTAMKACPKGSAGRLMTDMFFSFSSEETVRGASFVIRDHPEIDFTKGIFVVGQKGELRGYVPLREMLVYPSTTKLKEIMHPALHKVPVYATRQEVIDVVDRYKIASLAVVSSDNVLLGVITLEDIVEALEDLADQTMAMIAGTEPAPKTEQTIGARFCARAPWLFVTILSGFLNVGLISSSGQHFGESFLFVFFFVPLVTGLSGNIGIQCSTVLVRHFAIGSFCPKSRLEIIRQELASGFFSGLIFGFFCACFIYFFGHVFSVSFGSSPSAVALVVSSGLIGACFAGTLLGVFSPIFFLKIGVDPAISSGPIITAFNDFISMAIYFFIAWALYLLLFL